MIVVVDIMLDDAVGGNGPASGSVVVVQVRDTSLQDVAAPIRGEGRTRLGPRQGRHLALVEVPVANGQGELTVWALIDVDGDGRVSKGDYVTMQSYPVPTGSAPYVTVAVRPV